MNTLLYVVLWILVKGMQALPVGLIARMGYWGGEVAFWLDGRHRRVAIENLQACFGSEKSAAEIHRLARENFRRLGDAYCCMVKTGGMNDAEVRKVVEVKGLEKVLQTEPGKPLKRVLIAVGHFGNFELYSVTPLFAPPGYRGLTTYRGQRPEAFNRILKLLRKKESCEYFERRTEKESIGKALRRDGFLFGLLSDQHAGDRAPRIPFLGRDAATSTAPALYALRYDCLLMTGICYRIGWGRWRIEYSELIPTHEQGKPRPLVSIMQDVNRGLEEGVRRDPANWFWVHRRWRPGPSEPRGRHARRSVGATEAPEG